MDRNDATPSRQEAQHSGSHLPPESRTDILTTGARTSSPSWQTWDSVPDSFQPVGWSFQAGRDKPLPVPPSADTLASPMTDSLIQRRIQRSESLYSTTTDRPSPLRPSALLPDPGLLYPQMSPYDLPPSSRSAPPSRQFFDDSPWSPTQSGERLSTSAPRSPTLPGNSSRTRSRRISTGNNDNALQDEEEYRLFIEATAGIGPLPTFRQNSLAEESWAGGASAPLSSSSVVTPQSRPVSRFVETTAASNSQPWSSASRANATRYASAVSPVSEIPMSYLAYPRSYQSSIPAPLSSLPTTRSELRQDYASDRSMLADTDAANPATGMYADSRTRPVAPRGQPNREHRAALTRGVDDSWLTANDPPESDDELPTYASSQAQAHQNQRAEGMRRAQELQRRWREGGRRYGPDV